MLNEIYEFFSNLNHYQAFGVAGLTTGALIFGYHFPKFLKDSKDTYKIFRCKTPEEKNDMRKKLGIEEVVRINQKNN